MIRPLRLPLTGIALLVLAVAGCGTHTVGNSATVDADQLVRNMLRISSDINTYGLQSHGDLNLKGHADSGSLDMSIQTDTIGVYDVQNREGRSALLLNATMPENMGSDVHADVLVFLTRGTVYIGANVPQMSRQWLKTKMNDKLWLGQDQLAATMTLSDPGSARLAGSQNVEGQDCYLVYSDPDPAATWMVITRLPGLSSVLDDMSVKVPEAVKAISFKTWIATDTLYPLRSELTVRLNLTPGNTSAPGMATDLQGELNVSVQATFSNYNEPLSIDLPAETSVALEIPSLNIP